MYRLPVKDRAPGDGPAIDGDALFDAGLRHRSERGDYAMNLPIEAENMSISGLAQSRRALRYRIQDALQVCR